EYTGTATLSSGETGTATAKVFKEGGKLLVFPAIPSTLTCGNNQSIANDIGYPATPKDAPATYKGSEKHEDTMIGAETTLKESFKFSSPTAFSGTVSQEVPAVPSPLVVTPCSTGTISFKLHLR